MPAAKITALTELTSPASGDFLPIVDVSDTTQAATGTTKKIQRANLIPEFTPQSSSTAGAISLYEDTDNGTNKVTLIAPSSIVSDKTITLPDETGTALTTASTQTSLAYTTPKITTSINDANGNEVIKTPATASAVNEITVTNAATGSGPSISATGGDTNIGITISPKGTGTISITQEAVSAPSLQNSWVDFGSTFLASGYWKDSLGIVHLQGMIKSGTTTAGTTIFTLPTGYRPSADLVVSIDSNNAFAEIRINSNGVVSCNTSISATFVSLSNVHFRAA